MPARTAPRYHRRMAACARCASEVSRGGKFCVMCGAPRPPGDRERSPGLSRSGAAVLGSGIAAGAAVLTGVLVLILLVR